jgi:hypothetical protein
MTWCDSDEIDELESDAESEMDAKEVADYLLNVDASGSE